MFHKTEETEFQKAEQLILEIKTKTTYLKAGKCEH